MVMSTQEKKIMWSSHAIIYHVGLGFITKPVIPSTPSKPSVFLLLNTQEVKNFQNIFCVEQNKEIHEFGTIV